MCAYINMLRKFASKSSKCRPPPRKHIYSPREIGRKGSFCKRVSPAFAAVFIYDKESTAAHLSYPMFAVQWFLLWHSTVCRCGVVNAKWREFERTCVTALPWSVDCTFLRMVAHVCLFVFGCVLCNVLLQHIWLIICGGRNYLFLLKSVYHHSIIYLLTFSY